MQIRITTLSENTANYGYLAEWGLSILVEVDGLPVLLDTGYSHSAVHNAHLMGIDLSHIRHVVISHGHADHTGGLREVLRMARNAEVIGHPDMWSAKYVKRDDDILHYAGIPFLRAELESLGARFTLSKGPHYITSKIFTTGEIPMVMPYEQIEDNLFVKEGNTVKPDSLADDLALAIDTEYGLVVVLGCAHRGMINTLRHIQKLSGRQTVYAVIGGTHLFRASPERVRQTMEGLRQMGIKKLGVSHCTGFAASALLAEEYPGVFFQNNAVTQITLP
ncbi:MAG TPA: MBL fold metallo-hydrolase [Dehalococcoidia bacterium]|nr:MBL fold metallo-hydrolase [Dehalococcoidia bacterium]